MIYFKVLRWGKYPGLSPWADVITSVLIHEEGSRRTSVRGDKVTKDTEGMRSWALEMKERAMS